MTKHIYELISEQISGKYGEELKDGQKGTTVLGVSNMKPDGSIDFLNAHKRYLDLKDILKSSLKYGDILIAKSGNPKICCFEDNASDIVPCNFILTIRPNDGINYKYLYYAIRYMLLNGLINNCFTSTTIPNLKVKSFLDLNIKTCDIQLQLERVELLDSIVNNIKKDKKEILLLDELIKTKFQNMFGGIKRNAIWSTTKLGDHIIYITSGSRGWAKYVSSSGYHFITIKNVKNTKISFEDETFVIPPEGQEGVRTKVKEGDILISITADLGRTGVVTKEIANDGAYINQHLALVRVDRNLFEPLYVAYCLESEECKEQFGLEGRGGTKLGLNFDQVKRLMISKPPISVQKEFVDFCHKIERIRTLLNKRLSLQNELLDKKMHEYFD